VKKHYERIEPGSRYCFGRHAGMYRLIVGGYFRNVHTRGELRQLAADEAEGLPVRRRRLNIPTAYDDPYISRNYGRSWKDYTRRPHQWKTK
jgi:hypothetical protein